MEEQAVSPPALNDVTGVILAGGRSSRFGTNKALATFRGISLIDRVLNVMAPLFQDLLIVTNSPEEYSRLNVPLVADVEPYQGPLGGIFSALRRATNDRVFVVACDMPLLDACTIREIIRSAGDAAAAIPVHDGIREYLLALYSRHLMPEMCRALGLGRLSLKEFCFQTRGIEWIPIDGDSWTDVNSREDLAALEKKYDH